MSQKQSRLNFLISGVINVCMVVRPSSNLKEYPLSLQRNLMLHHQWDDITSFLFCLVTEGFCPNEHNVSLPINDKIGKENN